MGNVKIQLGELLNIDPHHEYAFNNITKYNPPSI